jgi:hypothetical protein
VGNQFTNYAILMFLYDNATPGAALGGAIHGKAAGQMGAGCGDADV